MDHHRAQQQQQHVGMQPQMMSSSAESGLQLLGNLNNSSNASGGNGNSLAGSDDPAPFNPIKSLLQQLQQQQREEEQQVDTFFLNLFFSQCLLDAVGSSGILKGKQNLGVTFNFDKQDVIDFTKFSKMTMCRASEANS